MLDTCFNLIRHVEVESCLSIGDSRARDAAYAKHVFGCYSVASDLNTSKLNQAVVDGFVDEVRDVDVENIELPDSTVDLVIAKETFHHWPRPFLGFYEMIRVCKKIAAFIEPFDCQSARPKPYLDEADFHDSYEEVGNYKYQISLREVLKAAWAMGLPAVAVRGFNDPYEPSASFDDWTEKRSYLDALGEAGERQFNLMSILVIKDPAIIDKLKLSDVRIYMRPVNPWAKS